MRPPYLCHCGNKVGHGAKCPCTVKRTRERKAKHDQNRPNARDRGYDHNWDKARLDFLNRLPTCRFCKEPATVVDHIKPHKGDPRLFWDRTNWQPLCAHHHNSTKQRLERNA